MVDPLPCHRPLIDLAHVLVPVVVALPIESDLHPLDCHRPLIDLETHALRALETLLALETHLVRALETLLALEAGAMLRHLLALVQAMFVLQTAALRALETLTLCVLPLATAGRVEVRRGAVLCGVRPRAGGGNG